MGLSARTLCPKFVISDGNGGRSSLCSMQLHTRVRASLDSVRCDSIAAYFRFALGQCAHAPSSNFR